MTISSSQLATSCPRAVKTPGRCARPVGLVSRLTVIVCVVLAHCHITLAETGIISGIETDKARYDPGQAVQFSIDLQGPISGTQEIVVRYRHLSEVVGTQSVPVSSANPTWSWTPPTDDFRGYVVDFEIVDNSVVEGTSSIAVDVSSDWAKFPRYGFLSKYDSGVDPAGVLDTLNRYHINGLQFYDWSNKTHQPLAGSVGSPAPTWSDIANRTHTRSIVNAFITGAHQHNMMAMSYNLIYGALDDAGAATDGVQDEWYLYTDTSHTNKDRHDLPAGWLSDIYLQDPSNTSWQNYLAGKMDDSFQVYAFDGWHMDQLGGRGQVYDFDGNAVDLANEMGPFVSAMKANPALANKRMVLNAVNQYGQPGIAGSNVDFLYTEVWSPNDHFNDLASIIQANNALSNNQLNTVLAAYVNYDQAVAPGTFNTPAVLLTDAVTFAFGGAHLELGEHMLGREYFPNDNLQMSVELQDSLKNYYDFLVGYQNLLRDGGEFTSNPLNSSNTTMNMWPAQQGSVSVVNKRVGKRELFHLINFSDATHMNWRDNAATQSVPSQISSVDVSFFSHQPIEKLWVATPDSDGGGVPVALTFAQAANGTVTATLPSLKYWTMLVAEAGPFTGSDDTTDSAYATGWNSGSNGGTGFGPWQLVSSSSAGGFAGFWQPNDAGGTLGIDNAGAHERGSGTAWASFANKGSGVDRATAFRTFDTSLAKAGDSFSITLENGNVEGEIGISLRNGNVAATPDDYDDGARLQFFFEGGDANYSLLDAGGSLDTGIAWTPFGVKIDFSLTGADTYDLVVWRYDQEDDLSPEVFNFTGRTLAGVGDIDSLALYQFDTAGAGVQSDLFFNYLSYTIAPLPGDFDQNSRVDGIDFLRWQRGESPNAFSSADLSAWEANYGSGNAQSASASTVPEPRGFLLVLMVLLVLLSWCRL